MSRALTLLFLFFASFVFGQNWKTINPSDTIYFHSYASLNQGNTANNILRVAYVDSTLAIGSDTIHYFYKTLRDTTGQACLDTLGSSWLGPQIVRRSNMEELYFNSFGDTILIRPNAALGENWMLARGRNGRDYFGTVTQIGIATIDGVSDSVKTISIQAFSNGNPVSDWYNNYLFELSRSHGWVRSVDMYAFPNKAVINGQFGAVSNHWQHHRLPKKFNRLELYSEDIFLKYSAGNEWIRHEIHDKSDSYTLSHDSVISFQPMNSTSAQISILHRELNVVINTSTSPPIITKTYASKIVTNIVSNGNSGIFVGDIILPESINDSSSALINPIHRYRWFLDTTCSPDLYIIESKSLTSHSFIHKSNGCLKNTVSLSGYWIFETSYLPGFGVIYDHREWGENSWNPFGKTLTTYPYIKLGNCVIGKKVIINSVSGLNKEDVTCFLAPNPAKKSVRLHGNINSKNLGVDIFSFTGSLVFQTDHISVGDELDVSTFLPGIYVVIVKSETGKYPIRLVIEK